MKEQKYIDYFVVTDENLKERAKYLTITPQDTKTFKTRNEAKKYMIDKILISDELEVNFSLTVERVLNPKYKLAEKIEELEKELAEKKKLMEELWKQEKKKFIF